MSYNKEMERVLIVGEGAKSIVWMKISVDIYV